MAHHGGNMRQLAQEYMKEGTDTFFENRLEEAALLVQNAIHLFKKSADYEGYTRALNLMGVIYAATGNETMAIDYYIEGLECAIDNHYDNLVALFYNNIGSRYQELNEHSKAIEYFNRAAKDLDSPASLSEPRHDVWCLVTYMNLAVSYRQIRDYKNANRCIELSEPYMSCDGADTYKYSFLISKCQLYWVTGKRDYVYQHLGELLESGSNDSNAPDYVQDMRNLCSLLKQMKEYSHWEEAICDFEQYANEQNSVYFKLIQTEMWMEYYQTIGEMKKYIHLCVEHMELYQRQKEITDKERASAIDIKIELRKKEAERKRAEEKSTTDALTGLGNRYLMEENAKRFLGEILQKKERVTVGVLDIDCFKQHNDTYGHIHGDECLRKVARILEETVGSDGSVYRFGGDEFVLFLLSGDPDHVKDVAERIADHVAEADMENINSMVTPKITISQGYCCFIPEETEGVDDLIEHADKALYYVKKHGRNGYHVIVE